MRYVYKVCSIKDWREASEVGFYSGSEVDVSDGFIHLSNVDQVLETLNCYFREEQKPLILILNESHLEDTLKWEIVPTRNNQSFPHLYRLLYYDEIDGVLEVRYEDEFYLGEYRKIDK